jgi:membrane-associated phospholipid phosphatase
MKQSKRFGAVLFVLVVISIPAAAQAADSTPCTLSDATHVGEHEVGVSWSGIKSIPRNSIRPANLAWELPIGAAAGLLISKGDQPGADRIQSRSLQATSGRWSNVGIGIDLAAGTLAWVEGCRKHHPQIAEAGFTALFAVGAVSIANTGFKFGFNRQYPYTANSTGAFWSNGHSFTSGHSATSFAFAAVVAHRYPHNPWIKWGAYALATGVSVSRYPAKKHFASDILVGGTLGYVTGAYLADHTR